MTFKIHRVHCPQCSKTMDPIFEINKNVLAFSGMRCSICIRDSFVHIPPLLFKNAKFKSLGGKHYEIISGVNQE